MARTPKARGRGRGPTEQELEETDASEPVEIHDPGEHDTPPLSAVLQADDPNELAVPVFLTNPVNVNQLPTHVGALFSKALAAAVVGAPAAVKILNADPRRAAITIPQSPVVLAIGRSQAEANDDDAFRIEGNQGPYRFHFTEELWARSTGAATRISVCVENWAR
jgi:hypothetical protein